MLLYLAESIRSCHVSKKVKYLLLGMMLLCTFVARAGMDPQALKQTITSRLGVPVYLVEQTPIPGLYMLGTSQGVIYSDAKGDYVVQGIMLDMLHDMKNLTVMGLRGQRRMALEQIGEPRMLLKAPVERHHITLFTNLECRNCRKVLTQLPQLQSMGVSIQILPMVARHDPSSHDAPIWCNQKALAKLNFSERLPAKGCSEILARYIGLSQWLGVKALPSWVLPNGDLVRGYQTPEQLLKILDHTDVLANSSSATS